MLLTSAFVSIVPLLIDVQRRLHVAPTTSVASKQSSDARQQVEASATSFVQKPEC
jgi:hypothetical protein